MILACPSCPNSTAPAAVFQNERYGAGRRVMTEAKAPNTYRCTVCGNSITRSDTKADGKPAK